MEKLIITAAICGAEVTKEHTEVIPYTVSESVREAKSAYEAGASIIHLHVREDDGTPTQSKSRFEEVITAIRKEIGDDVIIQVSTGGAASMSIEERVESVKCNVEMSTLDCGTLNFGGSEIFVNTEDDIKYVAQLLNDKNIKAELECFEKGHVDLITRLHKKGFIKAPMHFSFVLGVNGGQSGELRDFLFLKDSLPVGSTYSVAGVGRYEFPLATCAIIDGGHVRVGLEDNIYIEKGVKAKSNGELVEKVVRIAKELGREIATPQEARKILGMER
ncbi:MAG: 3-keto-5-aminohexanoate cleavage protein [Bacilli bacterium]